MVAAWERSRRRERRLRLVEADTAEHAITVVASDREEAEQPGVYEAWPAEDPTANLRMTLARPGDRQLRLRGPETA